MDLLHERVDLDIATISKRQADGATEVRILIWDRDGGKEPIGRFSLEGLTASQVAEQILDRAQRVVATMPGSQRVLASFTDDSGEPYGMMPFTLTGGADEAPREYSPDERGALGQTLRHNEFLIESTKQAMGVLAGYAAKDSKALRDENAALRAERAQWIREREEALTERHARELMTEESKARRAGWEKMASVAVSLIPVAVSMVTGKDMVPAKTTPAEVLLAEVVSRMDTPLFEEFISKCDGKDRLLWDSIRVVMERRLTMMSHEEKIDLDKQIRDLVFGLTKTDGWYAALAEKLSKKNGAPH